MAKRTCKHCKKVFESDEVIDRTLDKIAAKEGSQPIDRYCSMECILESMTEEVLNG